MHTFDILRNYANLPVETLQDLANIIDDPSNGMSLETNAHAGFDEFRWSLQETDVSTQTFFCFWD